MTDNCSNVVDCLCNVITSWKLREGFSTVFVIFWDYLLGRYVLCCWSDDYGYELCPNRKPNPLRLHFHNCVFYFRFLYVILLFNFVGDPNMNRPLLYHCNSPPLVSIVLLLNSCPSQPLKPFFKILICNPGFLRSSAVQDCSHNTQSKA